MYQRFQNLVEANQQRLQTNVETPAQRLARVRAALVKRDRAFQKAEQTKKDAFLAQEADVVESQIARVAAMTTQLKTETRTQPCIEAQPVSLAAMKVTRQQQQTPIGASPRRIHLPPPMPPPPPPRARKHNGTTLSKAASHIGTRHDAQPAVTLVQARAPEVGPPPKVQLTPGPSAPSKASPIGAPVRKRSRSPIQRKTIYSLKPKPTKTKQCKFWARQGWCREGVRCPFKHV